MRIFKACVYDGFLQGSSGFNAVSYSNPRFDMMLSAAETATIILVCDQVLGSTPTITAQIETSPDRRNWFQKNPNPPEINAAILNAISTTVAQQVKVGYDKNAQLGSGYNRLLLFMGAASGTASCRVRAYVVGHAEGLYRR